MSRMIQISLDGIIGRITSIQKNYEVFADASAGMYKKNPDSNARWKCIELLDRWIISRTLFRLVANEKEIKMINNNGVNIS